MSVCALSRTKTEKLTFKSYILNSIKDKSFFFNYLKSTMLLLFKTYKYYIFILIFIFYKAV